MLSMQADLPQEVQQVLPADPYAQLELANKIISFAYSQKVAQVESEAQQLREAVIGKQNTIKTLERRVSNLEVEVTELLAKNKTAVEDQHKLQSEKGALIETVKRLNREIAKLEAFKRSLIQHLQDEDEPSQLDRSLAAVDLSSERLVADVLSSANKQPGGAGANNYAAKSAAAPGLSAAGRAGMYGSPPRHGYNQSPPRDRHPSHPPTQATSHGNGSTGSPVPPAMDGKEFFRQARARLSYEQFTQFLNAIKDLNAGRHNREETLRFVQELCGSQYADLYTMFEGLLSRHMAGF